MKTLHWNYFFFCAICCFFLMSTVTLVNADQQPVDKSNFSHQDIIRLGTATKRFLVFRVVTVDLYIDDQYQAKDVLSNISKRLEVNYHVNIPKHELDRATITGIRRNFSQEKLEALMPQINQINSYYPDVKSGDQIAITYIPGAGSQIQLNGQVKGIVPGEEFAKAFFSIWLGENPVDPQAKLKLLGQ